MLLPAICQIFVLHPGNLLPGSSSAAQLRLPAVHCAVYNRLESSSKAQL